MPRRTFFSFHYQADVWRTHIVRNCMAIGAKDNDAGFFDNSVFEASKRTGDAQLKTFLRDGLHNSSVTCLLAGTNTWQRRWVRYEIARSILKGNGLLNVRIHGLRDQDGNLAVEGANPLDAMGLYLSDGGVRLAEWTGGRWVAYQDYTLPIPEGSLWFSAPTTNTVVQLSTHCMTYDFAAQNGRENLSEWIEVAAKFAER